MSAAAGAAAAAKPSLPTAVIVMGVSGSGKSTIGMGLARALGWDFRDGDAFHPAANVAKMKSGAPLTDDDRWPWLDTIARHVTDLEASTKARFEAAPVDGKKRRFKAFHDGAKSWSRVEKIIARVEVGDQGTDTHFVVTSLKKG